MRGSITDPFVGRRGLKDYRVLRAGGTHGAAHLRKGQFRNRNSPSPGPLPQRTNRPPQARVLKGLDPAAIRQIQALREFAALSLF